MSVKDIERSNAADIIGDTMLYSISVQKIQQHNTLLDCWIIDIINHIQFA